MTAAQLKRQPTPSLAQISQAPDSPKKIVEDIAEQMKNLPAVNFTFIDNQSPLSLPLSCAQVLHQEKLLDQQGQVIGQGLTKLHQEGFVRHLKLKLIYSIIKSHWHQHIFQTAILSSRTLTEKKYHQHLEAFSHLLADHYSYAPTSSFLADHYLDLASPRLELNNLPHEEALERAKKTLNDYLQRDKNGLAKSAFFYLKAVDQKASQKKAEDIITDLNEQISLSEAVLPRFNLRIDPQTFPRLHLSYSFKS